MSTTNDQKLGFLPVVLSVLASFIGIQSQANRERDFAQGKASHFIVAGIVLTASFIACILTIVMLVLQFAV